jgi:hypothetical protein
MTRQLAVFKDRNQVMQMTAPVPGAPPTALTLYNALFDTGASATCISPKLVKDLGLSPIGKVNMISASHVTPTNQYIFAVGFPTGMQQDATGAFSGQMNTFDNITGLEFQPAGASYDILVGMDIIRRGCLTVSFNGAWTFSF